MQMRKLGLFAVVLSVFLSVIAVWYWTSFSMSEARPFIIGDADASQKLLIVYQGSAYKNSIIETVVEHFSVSNTLITGTDLATLNLYNPDEYDAVFLLHTWEFGSPPSEVTTFLKKHIEAENVVRMSTTQSIKTLPKNVDAITCESILTNSKKDANLAIAQLELLID